MFSFFGSSKFRFMTMFIGKVKSSTRPRQVSHKALILFIIILLIVPHFSWAFQSTNHVFTTSNFQIINLNNRTVLFPKALGSVEHTFQGNDKLIIHIQDLHCHDEVQMNIARLISHLAQTSNLKLIGQEGSFNVVNTALIKTFPNKSIAKSISRHYVKQGKMTGAEYCVANDNHPLRLEGIDSPALYHESKTQLNYFFNHESLGFCYDLKEELELLKAKLYHGELKQWDRNKSDYNSTRLSTTDYAKCLIEQAKLLSLSSMDYSACLAFTQQLTDQKQLGASDQLFSEFDKLETQIRKKLYQNEQQMKLDQFISNVSIMERLLNISATNQELQFYQNHQEDFLIETILNFIQQHQQSANVNAQLYQLDDYLQQVMQFYHLADKRSDYFVEQLVSKMNYHKQKLAVMITGGFHSSAVLKNLEQKNISYISIKPHFSSLNLDNPYFSLLLEQASNYEKNLGQFQSSIALQTIWPDGNLPAQPTTIEVELLLESKAISDMRAQGYTWSSIVKKMRQLINHWPANTPAGIALDNRLAKLNPYQSQQSSLVRPALTLPTTLRNKNNDSLIIQVPNSPTEEASNTHQTIVENQPYIFTTAAASSNQPSMPSLSSSPLSWLTSLWNWLLRGLKYLLQLFMKLFDPIVHYRASYGTLFTTLMPPVSLAAHSYPPLTIGPGKMCPWIPQGPLSLNNQKTQITYQATNLNLAAKRSVKVACKPYTLNDIDEHLEKLSATKNGTANKIINWYTKQMDKKLYLLEENNDYGIAAIGAQGFFAVDEALSRLPIVWFYSMAYSMAAQGELTLDQITRELPKSHQLWLTDELKKVDNPQMHLWIAIDTMIDAAFPKAHQELHYQLQNSLPRHTLEAIARKYKLKDINGFIKAYLKETAHLQLDSEITHAEAVAEVRAVYDRIAGMKAANNAQAALKIKSILEQARSGLNRPMEKNEELKAMASVSQELKKLGAKAPDIMIDVLVQTLLERLHQPLQTNPTTYQKFLLNYSFSRHHPEQSTSIIITMCHHLLKEVEYESYDDIPLVLDNLARFFDETDLTFTGKTWEALQILLQDSLLHNIALIIPGDEIQSIPNFRRYFRRYPDQRGLFYFRSTFEDEIKHARTEDQVQLEKLYAKYVFKRDVTLKIYEKLLEKPIRHEVLASLLPQLKTLPTMAPTRIATLALLMKHWQEDTLRSATVTMLDLVVDSYHINKERPTRFHLEKTFEEFYEHLVNSNQAEQLILAFFQKVSHLSPQDPVRLELLNLIISTQPSHYSEKIVNTTLDLLIESYQVVTAPATKKELELTIIDYYQAIVSLPIDRFTAANLKNLVIQAKRLLPYTTVHQQLILILSTSDLFKTSNSILDELVPLVVNAFNALSWGSQGKKTVKGDLYEALRKLRIYIGGNNQLLALVEPLFTGSDINTKITAPKKSDQMARNPFVVTILALYLTLKLTPQALSLVEIEQWFLVVAIGAPLLTAYLLWRNASFAQQMLNTSKAYLGRLRAVPSFIAQFFHGFAFQIGDLSPITISMEQVIKLPTPPEDFVSLTQHRSSLQRWRHFLILLIQARVLEFFYALRQDVNVPDFVTLVNQPGLKSFLANKHFLLITQASPSLQQTLFAQNFKAQFLPSEINLINYIWLLWTKQLKQVDDQLITVYYPYALLKWFYISRQISNNYPIVGRIFQNIMILNHNMFINQFKSKPPNQPRKYSLQQLPIGLNKINQVLLPTINQLFFQFTPIKGYWFITGLSLLLWTGLNPTHGPLVWSLAFGFITSIAFVTQQALSTTVELEKKSAIPWGYQLMFRWPGLRWALWKIAPHHYWLMTLANTNSMGPYQDIILPVIQAIKNIPASTAGQVHERYLLELKSAVEVKLIMLSEKNQYRLLQRSIALFQELNPPPLWSIDFRTILQVKLQDQWINLYVAPSMRKFIGQWLSEYGLPILYQPYQRAFMIKNAV